MEEKKKRKISKDVLNIIRTTMRNNIELTHIADNKANVLLSLNALMLTFLIPLVIPYAEIVKDLNLVYPLAILVMTSLIVIYLSTLVLKPSDFDSKQKEIDKGKYVSPFFFGNFYKLSRSQFGEYVDSAISDNEKMSRYITDDLHYIGSRLGYKLSTIRLAFNVFIVGLIVSIILSIILIFIFH